MLAAIVLTATACGGGGDDEVALPLVSEIAPAMAAVDARLGGPQEYYEVNATPAIVNLFVATDGGTTATAFVFLDGELQPPAPPRQVAGGETFVAAEVDVDADAVFDVLLEQLPESIVAQFVVLGGQGELVRYEADVVSEQGGQLTVVLGPDGEILAVDPQ
jgi:hypothetical protein